MPEYTVYYTLREEEDLDFKADLFTEEDKPEDALSLKFEAKNDDEAKKRVVEAIQSKDKRPVRGIGKLKACRPKGKPVVISNKPPVLFDLNLVKEPLKTSIKTQIGPLLEIGDLTEEDGKIRVKSRDMLEKKVRKKTETTATEQAVVGPETEKTEQTEPTPTEAA